MRTMLTMGEMTMVGTRLSLICTCRWPTDDRWAGGRGVAGGGVGDQRAQDHTGRWYCITCITSNTCIVFLLVVCVLLLLFVLFVLFVLLVLHGLLISLVLLVLLKEQWWITPGGGDWGARSTNPSERITPGGDWTHWSHQSCKQQELVQNLVLLEYNLGHNLWMAIVLGRNNPQVFHNSDQIPFQLYCHPSQQQC